jgi:hypothetical protein
MQAIPIIIILVLIASAIGWSTDLETITGRLPDDEA